LAGKPTIDAINPHSDGGAAISFHGRRRFIDVDAIRRRVVS
jgi:hypothetical protein